MLLFNCAFLQFTEIVLLLNILHSVVNWIPIIYCCIFNHFKSYRWW